MQLKVLLGILILLLMSSGMALAIAPGVRADPLQPTNVFSMVLENALPAAPSITSPAESQVPAWAFNGAYANYQLTYSFSNGSTISGTLDYNLSGVDTNAQTFNVTTTYGGQLTEYFNPSSFSDQASFSDPAPFSALSPSDLQLANSGSSPVALPGIVTTGVVVSVPAGTITTDEINTSAGTYWVDQNSGLFVEVVATTTYQGTNLTETLTGVLQSTNSAISSTSPSTAFPILLVVGIIIIIVFAAGAGSLAYSRSRHKGAAGGGGETAAPQPPPEPLPTPQPATALS